MVRTILTIASVVLLVSANQAQADVLFEGYSKIMSGDQHIGYVVSRYEFDAKKKNFVSTYFLKTGKGPSEVTESVKAIADAELTPISYEYTTLAGKDVKTIDAKFKAGTMNAVIKNNGKISRIDKKIPKGTFLSTFLVYLMLKSKDGLRSDTNYEYQAIAEEDASIQKGQALVGKEEMYNGLKTLKILNTFKDIKFLSYVNDRGEVLGTNAMAQGISTELVANPADATAGQSYSATILKTLFGAVPEGKANLVSRAKEVKAAEAAAPAASKQMGVPAGQGIMIKAQPSKVEENKGN